MGRYIICVGDSFTDPNFCSNIHPEMTCPWPRWPEILGQKMGKEVINLGKSGMGNDYIYNMAVDEITKHDPRDIDYVFIGWSQSHRFDRKYNGQWICATKAQKFDFEGYLDKTMVYYFSLQQICKSLGIRYKQMQMISVYSFVDFGKIQDNHLIRSYIKNHNLYKKLDLDHFILRPWMPIKHIHLKDVDKYQLSHEDPHPNKKGHDLIARVIHDRI